HGNHVTTPEKWHPSRCEGGGRERAKRTTDRRANAVTDVTNQARALLLHEGEAESAREWLGLRIEVKRFGRTSTSFRFYLTAQAENFPVRAKSTGGAGAHLPITRLGKAKPPGFALECTPRLLQGLGLVTNAHTRVHGFLRLRRALSSSAALTPRDKAPLLAPEDRARVRAGAINVPDLNLLEHYATDRSVGLATPAQTNLRTGRSLPQGEEVTARTKASGRCRGVK